MQLLMKLTVAFLVLHTIGLGVIVGQRLVNQPHVQELLAIDDACGQDCWFSVPPDGTMQRREIEDRLIGYPTEQIRLRGNYMRFILYDEEPSQPVGNLQIALDNGYATEICFSPSQSVMLGDALAAFGPPDYFWLYRTLRWIPSTQDIEIMQYEVVYNSPDIVLSGTLYVDLEISRPRLPLKTPVSQICTPIGDSANRTQPVRWPEWQGFNVTLDHYVAAQRIDDDEIFSIQP